MRHAPYLVLGLLAVPLASQNYAVVPSKAATTQDGKYYTFSLFYGAPASNAAPS